jgi:hypothetical protein
VNYAAHQGVETTGLPGRTFTVKATERFQRSGVVVAPDTRLKVVAEGRWSPWPLAGIWCGPEGLPSSGGEVPGITGCALMARIGDDGRPFEIGRSREFRALAAGELQFAINDPFAFLGDNSGSLVLTIHTQDAGPPPPAAAATAAPAPVAIAVDRRTALVIGNSKYAVGPLRNPANDAQDMAAVLRRLGFEVTMRLDATQEQMEQAIAEFGRRLYQGGVGLFFYAGHGVQVDGENYLVPIGARIEGESDVRYKAVNVGQILGKMGEARNGLNIVILDACRDNPFSRGFRSATRGLAVVAGAAPKGTLIAFATSPGKVASDGDGRNGLYTKHLLDNIQAPGVPVEQAFKQVLQGVERETDGQQSPWTSSSFSGDFSFVPR